MMSHAFNSSLLSCFRDFVVVTDYFGVIDVKNYVCLCSSLTEAIFIADLLIEHFNGRPFKISILYLGDDLDLGSFGYNGDRDLNDYFEGVYCL